MLGVGRSHAGFGRAVGSRNDLHRLPRDAGPAHRAFRLREFEMIDGGLPADHRFAEAEVRVDDDLAESAQFHRAFQELGVGHQADLHEHACQRQLVLCA